MKNLLRLVFAMLTLVVSTVQATPVKWTLMDFVFFDGVTTASGSFVYDRQTNGFSEINIEISSLAPGVLDSMWSLRAGPSEFVFVETPAFFDTSRPAVCGSGIGFPPPGAINMSCGSAGFGIRLAPNELIDTGGVLPILQADLYFCLSLGCNGSDQSLWGLGGGLSVFGFQGATIVGELVLDPVPEPAALLLFAAGIPVVALLARRRKQRSSASEPPVTLVP